ncbi:MAG TPA: tetratricopeptide repeat protein [Burkholderiaceae bacterium]|nr:tetratricopeptide repeat protein [Burkholderiaceae bacterium]
MSRGVMRRDWRGLGLALTLGAIVLGGVAFNAIESAHPPVEAAKPLPHDAEVKRLFDAAVVMLHARQYEHAVTALHRVLAYAPKMPEAHANMGYALLGLQRPREARAFFDAASALAPMQANAYYGLALVHDAQGDRAAALGAMRTYVHLARDERAQHLARARAALWEWEAAASGARAGR